MKQLWQIAGFLGGLRAQVRFRDISQAPLKLLRFQMQSDAVECDWIARPADTWGERLPERVRESKASSQALKDAMDVRDMLFALLPDVRVAEFRTFRQSAREPPRLIIAGRMTRQDPAVKKVTELASRAKLYGFRFWLDDGVLVPLESVRRIEFAGQ